MALCHRFSQESSQRPNAWLQRRGANPRKLRRRKYHEKDAIAASAASHCFMKGCQEKKHSYLLAVLLFGSQPMTYPKLANSRQHIF